MRVLPLFTPVPPLYRLFCFDVPALFLWSLFFCWECFRVPKMLHQRSSDSFPEPPLLLHAYMLRVKHCHMWPTHGAAHPPSGNLGGKHLIDPSILVLVQRIMDTLHQNEPLMKFVSFPQIFEQLLCFFPVFIAFRYDLDTPLWPWPWRAAQQRKKKLFLSLFSNWLCNQTLRLDGWWVLSSCSFCRHCKSAQPVCFLKPGWKKNSKKRADQIVELERRQQTVGKPRAERCRDGADECL